MLHQPLVVRPGNPYAAVLMTTVSGFGVGIGTVSDHFTSVLYLPAGNGGGGGGPVEKVVLIVTGMRVTPCRIMSGSFVHCRVKLMSCR